MVVDLNKDNIAYFRINVYLRDRIRWYETTFLTFICKWVPLWITPFAGSVSVTPGYGVLFLITTQNIWSC